MTAIKVDVLRGTKEHLVKGVALIRAVYDVIYLIGAKNASTMLGTLEAGTSLLRCAHFNLCCAIGDGTGGLAYDDAHVDRLPRQRNLVLEQLDMADVSVRAAVINPFLMVTNTVCQEAAVEQIRSAAIILKNIIGHIESPNM